MSIRVINKNIFDSDCNIICHQVNCQGVMSHGIAKQVKEKYKGVYDTYKLYCDAHADNREAMLGEVLILDKWHGAAVCDMLSWKINEESRYIANIFGQLNYGKGLQTDYKALVTGLETVRDFALEHNNLTIAIPYKIGCGLAGGDWDKVNILIEGVFAGTDLLGLEVYYYKYEQNESY